MNQSENYSDEDWAALTAEQQAEALRIEKAVDSFLADSRAIRYVESDANKTALLDFLDAHNLEVTHANLLFGYSSLSAEGALELIPRAAPVVQDLPPAPSQRPAPVPTAPDQRAPQAFRNGRPIAFTNPRPPMNKMRAVYKDKQGATYSCPVEIHDNKWMMLTSEGFQPITHEFQDDVGGPLTFVEYRKTEDSRLHLEPKQPGQSSLGQLQSAAAKVEAQARADRRRAHQKTVQEAQPDPRQVEATMRVNAEYAALKKPRGRGVYIIKGDQ